MARHTLKPQLCGGLVTLVLLLAKALGDSQPGVPYLEGQENVCNGYICLNGGTCVGITGLAQCACAPGFTGSICETIISLPVKEGTCPSLPPNESGLCPGYSCANDAVCSGSQKCCQTGCSTMVCSSPIAIPQQIADPSQTSVCDGYCFQNGVCTESNGVPICACPQGYGGERCNVTIATPATKPGGCPSLPADLIGQCTGTACTDDASCSGTLKCCLNACSSNVCAEPVPDIARCDIKLCPAGSTCFQVRSSGDGPREAKCVLDADRTCWASGYARAHLIPSQSQPGRFDPIPCGSFTWFGRTCPLGTRCSFSSITSPSVCCSDQMVTVRSQNSYWSRRLHIYRRQAGIDPCGGCPVGQRCTITCEKPPCGTMQYQCQDNDMSEKTS